MPIVIASMIEPPPGERLVEVVERKGLGHPDTICDALAEAVSRALAHWYLQRFGRVLHYNVDKALLCGGSASPRFGGGEVTSPIEVILAGRATSSFKGVVIPVIEIATETCRAWLREHIHALDAERHVRISCRFGPGSGDLVDLYDRGADGDVPRANDTSIGVGFAPLSKLEETVLDVERWINARETKTARPETGEDVKVMGVRQRESLQLTVACALVSAHVADAAAYLDRKASLSLAISDRAAKRLGASPTVTINAADVPARGSFYLTVTGTSAEAGDDGQVGRGNRANGLITPGRAMTLEAPAGKNPVTHVGKIYNVTARLIAEQLVTQLPDVVAAECMLVSQIGARVDQPRVVSLRLRTRDGGPARDAEVRAAAEVAEVALSGIQRVTRRLLAGQLDVY